VRGGISVSIPVESTLARYGYDRTRLVVSHSLIFILGMGSILFFGGYARRTENELRQYSGALEQSNRDLVDFANIAAHDLRAPLVSIKGFSAELERTAGDIRALLEAQLPRMEEKDRARLGTLLHHDLAESLMYISASANRMDGLINSLLKLVRAGKRELTPERIEMEALTRGIINTIAHQIEEKNIRVTVSALPEIYADRSAMEQVMGNLLDNAVKYLDPARPGEVAITAETIGAETIFHIRDNGTGIAPGDIQKVFELFLRAGKQDVPGEGMGLAYVKTILNRHGGRIWCASALGAGTTFSFALPRRDAGAA
jgi:signal transduction histidine kinase